MKKTLLICLLGYLCVPTSTTTAQVADSPGADFLHRSVPQVSPEQGDTHRGGEIRPDTLPEKNGLVDHSGQGQKGEGSSASEGALIYGEIINPDSLHSLLVEVAPLGFNNSHPQEELELFTTHGTFFDGILDPRVQKFHANIPALSDVMYINLKLDNRPILENYLISPGDSIKISIDLQRTMIVFGGPAGDWLETQYQVTRAQKQEIFDSPRYLYENDREALLDRDNNRERLELAEGQFGARLHILEQGKDGLRRDLELIKIDENKVPGFTVLESRKNLLSPKQYSLLKSQMLGQYYGSQLSAARRYGYGMAKIQSDSMALELFQNEMPKILAKVKPYFSALSASVLTEGYLLFASEWVQNQAIISNSMFQEVVKTEFQGELSDRLLVDYTVKHLTREVEPLALIDQVLPLLTTSRWSDNLQEYRNRFTLHVPLQTFALTSFTGDELKEEDLKGSPTLLYFYFSSCAASEGFFKNYLWPLYEELAEETGFKIVAVSVDNDSRLWKESIDTYSDSSLINTNLPSRQWSAWLDYYLITGYPRTMLLDEDAKLLSLSLKGGKYADFRDRFLSLLLNGSTPNTFSYLNPSNLIP
ncbi:thiol-disulfide isomerase/thioredoxin [Algoriphagus sp. 4150]|uniref:TlpA family protein disulfide reductase n=1 Tax=Algoriphagus sp. 4150 TaxID=2817756 RepID=UPI002859D51F|nr:thioredoxin-like domain-containing protein [Algoriphagus sp. 4150]MDR7131662.1 thiol-disulfide isomerase/thioredoxin [Algoriphagus sp. 4150]